MSGSLAAFQDAFVAALTGAPGSAAGEVAALVGQPGFAVYRNTLAKGCVDALRAGVNSAHILDGRIPHVLLIEVFTAGGASTMIKA